MNEFTSSHLKRRDKRAAVRRKLWREQKGKCYYCPNTFNPAIEAEQPILEHFIPRHMRKPGKKHILVLSCKWCDKTKGMLTGFEYMEIVNRCKRLNHEMLMRQKIAAECKSLSVKRHNTCIRQAG